MKPKMHAFPIGQRAGWAGVVLALATVLFSPAAQAQREHKPKLPKPAPPQWRGDIARFHEHDWGVWRSGRWVHERHEGRLAWWWVVGAGWYIYPAPVYPYPNPWEPPPMAWPVPPVPPTAYWYYCEASGTYYPYVATCPGGWKQVPATPADAAPTTPR